MRSDGRKHLLRWHFLKPAKNLGRGEHLFTLVSELGHGGVRQSRPRAGPTGRPWQPSPWAGAAAGPGCSACSPPPPPPGSAAYRNTSSAPTRVLGFLRANTGKGRPSPASAARPRHVWRGRSRGVKTLNGERSSQLFP